MIQADEKTIFDYVSDWEKQSNWVLFTTVEVLANSVPETSPLLSATTKLGPIKFVDTMSVTTFQPNQLIVAEHTGRVVLGKGVFSIKKISNDSCRFIWQEITPVPFGIIGQFGLVLVKPLLKLLFGRSLRKLKSQVEQYSSL